MNATNDLSIVPFKEIPHYSELLFQELQKRCIRNRNYSLRSFARDLSISPSFISRIFRKEANLTLKKSEGLVKKLNWPNSKKILFIDLVQYFNCPAGDFKNSLCLRISNLLENHRDSILVHKLESEHKILLESWVHFALLELATHKELYDNPEVFSLRLGVSKKVIKDSLKKLLMFGLLEEKDGKFSKGNSRYWIGGDFPSNSVRKFHGQHLSMAEKALEQQNFSERVFMGTTFSVYPEQLDLLKTKIQEFHSELLNVVERGVKGKSTQEQVYHVGIQLYRLDRSL